MFMQTLAGKKFDLMQPRARDVSFREIAHNLAQINRYAGATTSPVSVAQHTLIVFSAAEERDKPYALLHDAHEAYMGDIPTPVAKAIGEIGRTCYASPGAENAINALKDRLDAAIYDAAGLPFPSLETQNRIRKADLVALATERRDFLAAPLFKWSDKGDAELPLKRVYRWRAASNLEYELLDHFKTYLPNQHSEI